VLVMHGGASRGAGVRVSPTQLSVLRMVPTARAVAGASKHLAVYRLLNTYRGWDESRTPVQDADAAIAVLQERHPDLPVGLVGHSLGGRAALETGDSEHVRSVVALNPWVYPTDDFDLSGRRVLVVHGGQDRIASPQRSEQVVRRVARRTSVGLVWIPEGKHAMLRHGGEFDRCAAEFTAAVLLDDDSLARSEPVRRVLAGEPVVTTD
jgi:alpha-beta hydrolase superfamily lysophospholipase